jgi:hypothetical protein
MMNQNSTLTIRTLTAEDQGSIERLAQLDSQRAPQAPLLGAEVEGRLLAAVSLSDGELVADPFSRTAELRALLELRASQFHRRAPRRRGRRHPAPARGALAGSPRGAGEGLLSLHPRAS